MTIVCISGYVGSGKTTVALKLAELLDYPHLNITCKDIARERGMKLEEVQKLAEEDRNIDIELDKLIVKRAREMGGCVVSTWLSPWMIPESFKAWLEASPGMRASRVAGRENITAAQALEHVNTRDSQNIERYKKLYSIDISKHEMFNLVIANENKSAEEVAGVIAKALKEFEGR